MAELCAVSSPGLTLCLLGGWTLLAAPAPPVEGFGIGARRLLALLALRGPTSRSSARELLWPQVARHQAAQRVRNTLWRLDPGRYGLGSRGLVEVSSNRLALAPQVTVDVHALVAAVAAVQRGESAGIDARIFEADLLPTWDDDWLLFDRERIRQLRVHSLESLSHTLLEQGRHALALDAALSALHADPLRESAHRAVIRVHLAEGNHHAALRAFEDCRAILDTELGVRPTRALLDLMAPLDPCRHSARWPGSTR